MAERRITCPQCRAYDREGRRCRFGKANPKKKHVALTLAEMLGPRALCLHSPFREPLLLRMHAPNRRFVWDEPQASAIGSAAPVEVEIIEEELEIQD